MQRFRVSRLVGALAPVAELADAADSKSAGLQGPCGFDSRLRHHSQRSIRAGSVAEGRRSHQAGVWSAICALCCTLVSRPSSRW